MSELPPTFEPRRFRSTVPFYARYRLAYPGLLLDRVAELAGLERGDEVLDLGAGPGIIAIPFGQLGMRVTAVDPEPDMLAAAQEAADAAGVTLDLRLGSSFAMPPDIGPFKLVTIGRAFHWMDRERTLDDLAQIVLSNGAVALFGERHPKTAENAWQGTLDEVGERYSLKRHPLERERSDPGYRSDESLLLDSPFPRLERCGVFLRRGITVDEVVGHAFSRSATSPEKLGDQSPVFEGELREALRAIAPDGRLIEIAELTALVARRK